MRFATLALVAAVALPACKPPADVDREASHPVLVAMDVAPGYRRSVEVPLSDQDELALLARITELNPSAKWRPTVFICLRDAAGETPYCLNLSHDAELDALYGRARLFGKDKSEVANVTTSGTFPKEREIPLRLTYRKGVVEATVDGVRLDRRRVDFDPVAFSVGGSSAKFTLRFLEPPQEPATASDTISVPKPSRAKGPAPKERAKAD